MIRLAQVSFSIDWESPYRFRRLFRPKQSWLLGYEAGCRRPRKPIPGLDPWWNYYAWVRVLGVTVGAGVLLVRTDPCSKRANRVIGGGRPRVRGGELT